MKKFWIFLAICFGISYGSAALFKLLGGQLVGPGGFIFASCYMVVPLISVVLTQLITGEKVLSGCGVSFRINRWWLVGLVSMPVFALLTIPVSALFPGVSIGVSGPEIGQAVSQMQASGLPVGPWGLLLITLLSGLIAACTINALFAFGEEVAWRGFLSRCLDGLTFWKKSLLVGAVWGIWHAPLILMGHNYPAHPVAGVFMMVAFCMLFAPMIQFIRDRSGSVIAAAVMHGSLNAVAGIANLYLCGFNDLLCGCPGAAGMAILLVSGIVLAIIQRRNSSQQ